MTEMPTPLLFWAGYSSSVLVSSAYLQAWTVMVSNNPRTRIFPRRWFDLEGKKMSDVWESALKAIVGVVIFRPGVPQVCSLLVMAFIRFSPYFRQTELRWRLRPVYDRQEVNDGLHYLQQEGVLRRQNTKLCLGEREDIGHVQALDGTEEKNVFWFIGNSRHWYQV